MASTDVDICNLALGIIGDKRIQSMTERSVEAVECGRFYGQALDESLEAYDWPFARSFARAVAPSGVDILPGYASAFAWPKDAIAIRGIARSMRGEAAPEFVMGSISGKDDGDLQVIYTNHAGAYLAYTRRVTDPRLFTPLFVSALAAKLAFYLAMPLKKSASDRDRAEKLFDKTIEQAAVSVANQGRNSLPADVAPDWIAARG